MEGLFGLIQDLNESGRCVGIDLAGWQNEEGLAALLSRRAGAPTGVAFDDEGPQFRPGYLDDCPEDEHDLVVGFNSGAGVPWSLVVSGRPAGSFVAIATAVTELEVGGTFIRPDDVALRIPVLASGTRPTIEAVLEAILARLDAKVAGP
jgi:formylmethanofuran dehydrogenase subunit B